MINRKQFLGMTTAAAGSLFIPTTSHANEVDDRKQQPKAISKEFVLSNVTLEQGFEYNDKGQVMATLTNLYDIHILDGVIKSIVKANTQTHSVPRIDGGGFLLLPGFRDMHIHIDKTFYGDKWYGEPRAGRTVKDMIDLERRIIPDLLVNSTAKAEKSIELMNSQGTYFVRCQTNIDPVSGLKSLEHLQKALANKSDVIQSEIVAFPQHGIMYWDCEALLRESAQMGIDFIGGLDPTSVDGNMQKSLDIMFKTALDYGKGVDIHLHEGAKTGLPAIEYMIKTVSENKALEDKTFISHGFALGQLEPKELERIAEQLAHYKIGVISTVPIGRSVMPIPTFYKYGVKVMTGTDSIVDHWQPFGNCDMLEKAKLCAQLYGWTDDYTLSRALQIATKDQILPLDNKGNKVWPNVGDQASFVLVEATCSAEAVARNPKRELAFNKGKQIL